MIMSYSAHRKDFGSFVAETPSKSVTTPKKTGVLRRVLNAMMGARQREANRQIARFLAARSALTLTDGLEREISQRLSTSNWRVNVGPYG
jgi:hypothetical protein